MSTINYASALRNLDPEVDSYLPLFCRRESDNLLASAPITAKSAELSRSTAEA